MPATHERSGAAIHAAGWLEPAAAAGFAENWDAELFGIRIPAWRWPVVRAIEAIFHRGDGSPIVIADIGCGAATYARHLLTTGIPFEYHGFDHNPVVLEAAAQRWRFLLDGAPRFQRLDARAPRWPLDDSRFDVVLWDSTIRFVEDVPAAIRESTRVARRAILLARTPLEPRTWREEVHYYGMSVPSANWHFDQGFFESAARNAGWSFTPSLGDPDLQAITRGGWPGDAVIQPGNNAARAFHAAYVRERVDRLIAMLAGDWAVYGGGAHTRWLLAAISEAARARIRFVIDDAAAPGQSVFGRPVARPACVEPQSCAGVIVSSDTIEQRLTAAACSWLRDPSRVYRLYADLPLGPYDKAAV